MDLLNSVKNELQMDYIQFLSVAFGVAFLSGPLLLNVTLNTPFLNSLPLATQNGFLAGIYAIVGNWLSRMYRSS
jgi:hypothetical protein